MSLSDYLIESILSKKTGMYGPDKIDLTKKSVISWLQRHGFRKIEYENYEEDRLKTDDWNYQLGPFESDSLQTHWISIHNDKLYEMCLWFDKKDRIEDCAVSLIVNGKLSIKNPRSNLAEIQKTLDESL